MLRQILLLLLLLRNPCASERDARLRRQRDLNDHIHRIQFSLSSRGKMPAGVHDALLTLNADGCEIECQPVELKGLPRGSEKSCKRDGKREGSSRGTRSFGPFNVLRFRKLPRILRAGEGNNRCEENKRHLPLLRPSPFLTSYFSPS